VTDTYGNPVPDVAVTFAVTSGGGSLTRASQVTGTTGVAAVGSWRVGSLPGPNTLKGMSAGLTGSPVTFHATATNLPATVTVEVHSAYFLSLQNGSGGDAGFFGSRAVDTIAVGGTVTWQWVDSGHNVTPFGNSAFTASGTESAPFTFGPITFSAPSTYLYVCTIHSRVVDYFGLVGMTGMIVVL
jgi:plastocyanin